MPDAFWIEEYRRKANAADPIAQSGRGSTFQTVEFLHVMRQALELLRPEPESDVLDVGCGNGLIDVVLSGCCRSLLALEPVPELAKHAGANLAGCSNVRVEVGHGGAVPAPDAAFDRALLVGVLQLIEPGDARAVFAELRRVSRPGARIVLASVPDARVRDRFLGPYLDGVRRATHLSEDQKAAVLERNRRAHWYDAAELAAWWERLGGVARRRELAAGDPDRDHRFHLVVSLGD
jgi:cyclopropane fatty-acyl-phospholipid synthase-like methyltransferase